VLARTMARGPVMSGPPAGGDASADGGAGCGGTG
jgi:hypothetical protein